MISLSLSGNDISLSSDDISLTRNDFSWDFAEQQWFIAEWERDFTEWKQDFTKRQWNIAHNLAKSRDNWIIYVPKYRVSNKISLKFAEISRFSLIIVFITFDQYCTFVYLWFHGIVSKSKTFLTFKPFHVNKLLFKLLSVKLWEKKESILDLRPSFTSHQYDVH